jgi:hypothetical protein
MNVTRIRTWSVKLAAALFVLGVGGSVASAGTAKADICHWDAETQSFSVINVSTSAVSAHFRNHGDSAPADYWSDADGDGFGDAGGTHDVCPQTGLVANADDCDDSRADVNPGAAETPYNGLDDDCDAATPDDDLDNDGYGLGEDCDEQRADVNPGMPETPYNGLDDDCNAATLDDDLDLDGFGHQDDCDDTDSATHPGAFDVCGDGIDNSCDGRIDEDCASGCPCFGPADIDAAYEHYRAEAANWPSHQLSCWDEDYSNYYYGYESTGITFNNYYYSYPDYERDLQQFYAYGYDEYYGYNYCHSYADRLDYNYWTGQYEQYNVQNDYRYISAEERDACAAVVRDWAANAGIACYVYSY